jgi:hypothetical protein
VTVRATSRPTQTKRPRKTVAGVTATGDGLAHDRALGPTLAAVWHGVAGRPIGDELLEWPPDLFALTDTLVERSQADRFAISPPPGSAWPPRRLPQWAQLVEASGREWSGWVEDRSSSPPAMLAEEWAILRARQDTRLRSLGAADDWRLCEALLTLHAIADEACAGLGVPLVESGGTGCVYRAQGRELLARTGSLARIEPDFVRVLPKVRTSPQGTSHSSLSRYACVIRPGVEIGWHKVPARHSGTDPRSDHANLLLLPWPLRVRDSDFRTVEGSLGRLATDPSGLFEFAPSEPLDLDLVDRLLSAALDEVDSVDSVVLPESAITEEEIDPLEALLEHRGVAMLQTGVRAGSGDGSERPANWVHTGISPRVEKGGSAFGRSTGSFEQWFHVRQNKHHRWTLDETQIYQYHLGGALHPLLRWGEAIDIPRRTVQFVELGEDIVIVSLVCEDLAQDDSVAEILRSVGPTIVFTPLLDGPQLSSRWTARYASVLADDPGSAVITLTSFGMANRSRPHGHDASPVVALTKCPGFGLHEVSLEQGAQGILMTVCGDRGARRTTDGRLPIENATRYFDVAVLPIRAAPGPKRTAKQGFASKTPPPLSVEDVTVLTSFTQAVAEALTDPSGTSARVDALLTDARPGTEWREELGLPEPSPPLTTALEFVEQLVRAASPPGTPATLGTTLKAIREQPRSEPALHRVARRVLRSTLEQRQMRRMPET